MERRSGNDAAVGNGLAARREPRQARFEEAGGRVEIGPITLNESELEAWGRRVGERVEPPAFFALRGELGAGKSVLARAIARGAGVEGPMPSPTFNLVYGYAGRDGVDVWHLDLYRLDDPEDVWELGWRELGTGHELVLVEWPERAEELLPPDRWEIRLEHVPATEGDDDDGLRVLSAERVGAAPELPRPSDSTLPEA